MKTDKKFLKYALILLVPGLMTAQEGNVANGKRLYVKDGCYECHGYAGQGGAGARLAPHVLPAANLIKYVRHPSGAMPPYTAKVVSDAELTDIRAFLASLPEPPPLKSIPILNQ
jgi:ubiquinol-cytochrome c reductase cytochrome c subunit